MFYISKGEVGVGGMGVQEVEPYKIILIEFEKKLFISL